MAMRIVSESAIHLYAAPKFERVSTVHVGGASREA